MDFTADYGLKTRQAASWLWLRRGVLTGRFWQLKSGNWSDSNGARALRRFQWGTSGWRSGMGNGEGRGCPLTETSGHRCVPTSHDSARLTPPPRDSAFLGALLPTRHHHQAAYSFLERPQTGGRHICGQLPFPPSFVLNLTSRTPSRFNKRLFIMIFVTWKYAKITSSTKTWSNSANTWSRGKSWLAAFSPPTNYDYHDHMMMMIIWMMIIIIWMMMIINIIWMIMMILLWLTVGWQDAPQSTKSWFLAGVTRCRLLRTSACCCFLIYNYIILCIT